MATVEQKFAIVCDEHHKYFVNGKPKMGLTECLKEAGLVEFIGDNTEAMFRGKAGHKATELLDAGKLDWSSVTDSLMGYVLAYESFIENSGWRPLERELMMYSPALDICTTIDGRYELPGGDRTICEIKTGEVLQPYTRYQTALQHEICKHNALYAERRHAILLRSDSTYQLTEFRKPTDLIVGVSAVNVAKAKRGLL